MRQDLSDAWGPERGPEIMFSPIFLSSFDWWKQVTLVELSCLSGHGKWLCVCVYVCVRQTERERQRDRERERVKTEKYKQTRKETMKNKT